MRILVMRIITAILALLGAGLFLYPYTASWISQYHQSREIDAYVSGIENIEPARQEQIAQAHKYNEALRSGANLLPGQRKPIADSAIDERLTKDLWPYEEILKADSNGMIGRLQIPSIDVDLPIQHGTSEATLRKAVGHLEGTSFPVGGGGTRTVLTAHRGLPSATLFNNLDKVSEGDLFTVETFGEILTYRVIHTQVVQPEDSEAVRAVPGEDLATLVTCTPLGINSHRILVTGERVYPNPEGTPEPGETSDLPRFPWWAVGVVVTLIIVVALVYSGVRQYRKQKNTAENAETRRKSESTPHAS
ncbi:MAG: class C sortase [Actinomycetaceae bacterium]|nr:class C sortase [Actinomycetaceae bacterium]